MTRLTYCGNVHPSETLDGWIEACREHALPVAEARRAAGVRRFGLGAWWTAEVAAELVANPSARERVEAFLASSAGGGLLAACVVLQGLGILWIRRLGKVQV